MNSNTGSKAFASWLIVLPLVLASGCATVKQVKPEYDQVALEVVPGDLARIVMRDGTRLVLTVTRIEDDALIGMTRSPPSRRSSLERRVDYSEMDELSVKHLSKETKTKRAIGWTLAGIATLVLVIISIVG